MVYTLTLNPSLDYVVTADGFGIGGICRADASEIRAGGKGINVSAVLAHLGIENTALGIVGGGTGKIILEKLAAEKIRCRFIEAKSGESRINTKIICPRTGSETQINGVGCPLTDGILDELGTQLSEIGEDDLLVISGSLPPNADVPLCGSLISSVRGKVILDACGDVLLSALHAAPYLIKPNREELEEICGKRLETRSELLEGCLSLQRLGARNVLLSLGGDGAMLVCGNGEVHFCAAPHGDVKYTVGAGDSAVAGFVFGMLHGKSAEERLKCAVAAGSATSFGGTLTDMARFENILKNL